MKKKKWIFGILVLTILAISGISFALWQVTLEQESENIINTSCFKITLKEANPIGIQNAYPISDEEGMHLVPFEFSIENRCETYASYQINLEVLNSTTLDAYEFMKVSFDRKDERKDASFLTSKEEVSPTLKKDVEEFLSKKAYMLETGYLDIGAKKEYELSLWLDEDTPADDRIMNKIFQSKISVIATYKNDFDYEKPIAKLQAFKEGNQIFVDASGSTDNTLIKNYYYNELC